MCVLYKIEENGFKAIDNVRHKLFVIAKRNLEMSRPTQNALELHIKKIRLSS